MNIINFNFKEILNIAQAGVRRSAMFMGLGLNAANNPNFKEYLLSDFLIDFIPQQLNDEDIKNSKKDFSIWIQGNGFREVNEYFEVFVDKIYEAIVSAASSNMGQIDSKEFPILRKKIKKFEKESFEQKLKILSNNFRITTTIDCHSSIKKARNCLTHRLGLVKEEDCNDGEHLTVKWFGLEFVETKEGEEEDVTIPNPVQGHVLGKGHSLAVKHSLQNISFMKGAIINLSPDQINGICYFYLSEAENIKNLAVDYVKSCGINFID